MTFFTAFHQIFYQFAEVAQHISVGIYKAGELTSITPAPHPVRVERIDLNFDGYKEHRNAVRAGFWTDSEDDEGNADWSFY